MQIETQKHLAKAKEMIQDPEHWTQLCKARDKDGVIVGLDNPSRHSICLISSLQLTTTGSSMNMVKPCLTWQK